MTYYTAIVILCALSMVTMQLCVSGSNTLTKHEKRCFRFEFFAIVAASLCEWVGVLLDGTGPETRELHLYVKVLEFCVAPFIGIFMAVILDAPGRRTAFWVLMVHALAELVLSRFGLVIQLDEMSVYSHGPMYWIYMAVYFLAIFYSVFAVLGSVKRYQYGGLPFLIAILVFTLVGFVFHLVNSRLRLDYLTTAISAIMIYVFTLDMIQQTDELTGLINRRGYENRLDHLEDKCVILFVDVDKFKGINDTYGHQAGDRCLRTVGTVLRETYGHYGRCYRIGGDEFCVILTKHTQWIRELDEDLTRRMDEARGKDPIVPTLSIGYAHFDPAIQSPVEAIEAADRMMYQNKQAKHLSDQR